MTFINMIVVLEKFADSNELCALSGFANITNILSLLCLIQQKLIKRTYVHFISSKAL